MTTRSRRAARCAGRVILLAGVALVGSAGSLAGQSGRIWRPEERVLISAFHTLGAVATDGRGRVYAASPNGVQIYEAISGRWDLPLTATTGYPAGEQPRALVADLDGGLLLGTASGGLFEYRPVFGEWQLLSHVPAGSIQRMVRVGLEQTLYIATPGGWFRLPRGGLFPEPVPASEVPRDAVAAVGSPTERLSRMDPYFDAARGTLTLDERLRRWTITDAVPADAPLRFWLATDGGLWSYDSRRMAAEPLPYGLLSPGVGVVAVVGDELWFGGDGRGRRRGVVAADRRLERWRQYESGYDGAPSGYVEAIAATSGGVWFGASDGLYLLERRGDVFRRLLPGDGLPDEQVTSLAAGREGVWVGTRRGAVLLSETGEPLSDVVLPGTRINRLRLSRDTLWLATESGAFLLPGGAGSDGLTRPPGAGAIAALAGRVMDVRPDGGALLVLTEDALFRFEEGAWSGPIREPVQAGLGRLRQLAAAEGQLWIAGERGVGRLDRESSIWTYYLTGADVPEGPVRGILPDGEHVWLATPSGALRLTWR